MDEPHAHVPAPQSGEPRVELTDVAVDRFRKVMEHEGLGAGYGVRIAVNSGGCSGMSYAMSFESEARPGDAVIERNGLRLYVDRQSAPYLEGVTIDYVVGLHKEGFKFVNPRAARTCGCGESFSV
ncbi:MAG: iron-sulfur cluster assembly accessory protein [Deltaproteobacteria bacterium]|nr:iron-sulfur cluster assembly accessory protein [Deltaproteobacteria bacterium]